MLDSNWFKIVIILLSVLMAYISIKRLKLSLEDTQKELSGSIVYAEKFGQHAILVFSSLAVAFTIAYIVATWCLGLLPLLVVSILIVVKLVSLMLEYGALQGTWGYGKRSFAFDKIQCWINIATAITVILRFFMTGLIAI